jgi:hypothetical protein
MGITHDMREQVSTWVALEAGERPGDGLDIGYWVELRQVTGTADMEYFEILILLVERAYQTMGGGCLRAAREFVPRWPLREDQVRSETRLGVQQIREYRDADRRRADQRRQQALRTVLG